MRPRGSITAPLILILLGIFFLLHSVMPEFHIGEMFTYYWPYLLIVWGFVAFLEVCVRFVRGGPIPTNGVSGGAWGLVVILSIVGLSMFEVRHTGNWWQTIGFRRGMEAFGEEHQYSFPPLQRTVAGEPRIVIESFRGDAKITGANGSDVTVSGHKSIRAFDGSEADQANGQTPVEVLVQGKTLIIRCNQERSSARVPVTTNLDISVPKGASIEATGSVGDFDISSISGDLDLSSGNAGVRVQDVGGHVKIDTRRSDLIRCNGVAGAVDVRGHGQDVELTKISGQVTVTGDYSGTVSLREVSEPVRVQSSRTKLEVEQVPGEIRLERGNLNLENVVGPLKLSSRVTDVTISNYSNGLELTVDKGDIDLRPGRLPLGKTVVHARSGNIELALPQLAHFSISAITDHGEIDNQFGETLRQQTAGRGARLQGSVGDGPEFSIGTGRGSITIRKASVPATTVSANLNSFQSIAPKQ